MRKQLLYVPEIVNYINQWSDFREQIPDGHVILNKVYPGCGMTTYFLESSEPVILAAPRRALLDNKARQMLEKHLSVFLFTPSSSNSMEKRKEENDRMFQNMGNYICKSTDPYTPFTPKILVTYDSLPIVYKQLQDYDINFTLIVDEFHVAFQDYDMKPETIERFFCTASMMRNVIYLSATPIMETYLDRMEIFRDLPYIELKWPPSKIATPLWTYKNMKSTLEEASRIIQDFKSRGVFDTISIDGTAYNSTEAVFFINDVRNISNIINRNNLTPAEVNILVADTQENRKKLPAGFTIGQIPLMNEPHKTYTFCSKTVFFGCDFYSTNASTYIFADANIKNMCSDIALDLPQIAGRQRLSYNPFRDRLTVYVKYACNIVQDYEDYKKTQAEKEDMTNKICEAWKTLPACALAAIKVKKHECPYGIIYQDPANNDEWTVKKSMNAMISEDRAWELRNCIYRDRQSFTYLAQNNGVECLQGIIPEELELFYSWFLQERDSSKKMEQFCYFFDAHPEYIELMDMLHAIPAEYKNYYCVLGTNFILQKGFDLIQIEPEYNAITSWHKIKQVISSYLIVGHRYSKAELKRMLQDTYASLNYRSSAKATDLFAFYEMKECVVTIRGERVKSFEIIREKVYGEF